MRLYEFEKGRAGEFATQRDQTLFDFEPGAVANWPGWIKHPKHGVLGFAAKDNDPIPTAVQGWLRSLGYSVEQDGVFGRETAGAMHDAMDKIRNGQIKLPNKSAPAPAPAPKPSGGDYRTQPYGMKN
jgi:hypothetical protein